MEGASLFFKVCFDTLWMHILHRADCAGFYFSVGKGVLCCAVLCRIHSVPFLRDMLWTWRGFVVQSQKLLWLRALCDSLHVTANVSVRSRSCFVLEASLVFQASFDATLWQFLTLSWGISPWYFSKSCETAHEFEAANLLRSSWLSWYCK